MVILNRYSQRRRAYWEDASEARIDYVFLTKVRERLRGLLFREPDELVRVLVPCNAVHTLGMTCDLDIAFLDGEGVVLAVYRRVGKRRHLRCSSARMTLERFADARPWFSVGDRVTVKPISRFGKEEREDDL